MISLGPIPPKGFKIAWCVQSYINLGGKALKNVSLLEKEEQKKATWGVLGVLGSFIDGATLFSFCIFRKFHTVISKLNNAQ